MSKNNSSINVSSTNFYDHESMGIERAILAEDLKLPELPAEPLSLAYLEKNGTYKLAFNEYMDTAAKFFIKIMTPLVDKEEAAETNGYSPSTRGHKGDSLNTGDYTSTNYVTLTIPKYILLNFAGTIPKGTEFLVVSPGNSMNLEDMKIVGLYSTFAKEA